MIEDIFLLILVTVAIIMFTAAVPFILIWNGAEQQYSKDYFAEAKSELTGIYTDYFDLVKLILFGGR